MRCEPLPVGAEMAAVRSQIEYASACLEAPADEQISMLAQRAAEPEAILPERDSHFVTWIQGRTPDRISDERVARLRANRDLTRRPGWALDLAVMVRDEQEPVGLQSLSGFDQWPRRRIVGTTSWLLASYQGNGLGTRCRAAVLELAFTYLDAEAAKFVGSWVLEQNVASVAVSTRLGYRLIDHHDIIDDGRRYTELVYQLDRQAWLESGQNSTMVSMVECWQADSGP